MQDPPPKGTWIAYVRSMQKSHMIQDLVLPEHVQQSTRMSQRRGQIRKYAKQVVRPRVGKAAMAQKEGGLPWVWMAKNLTTKEHVRCFEQWWVWRIQGRPPWDKQENVPYVGGKQYLPRSISSGSAQKRQGWRRAHPSPRWTSLTRRPRRRGSRRRCPWPSSTAGGGYRHVTQNAQCQAVTARLETWMNRKTGYLGNPLGNT